MGIDEAATPDDVIAERHRGIRPGFGYPACPGSQREVQAVRAAGGRRDRHGAHRACGDDAGRERERPVLRPSPGALFHGRPNRGGPDRQLRPPEGVIDRIGGTVADSLARLRAGPVFVIRTTKPLRRYPIPLRSSATRVRGCANGEDALPCRARRADVRSPGRWTHHQQHWRQLPVPTGRQVRLRELRASDAPALFAS